MNLLIKEKRLVKTFNILIRVGVGWPRNLSSIHGRSKIFVNSPKCPGSLWNSSNLIVNVHQGKCNRCLQFAFNQCWHQECMELYLHFHYTFVVCAGTALPLWKQTSAFLRHIMGWWSPFWVNIILDVSSAKHIVYNQITNRKIAN
jgi:hypothetical protein